MKGVHSVIVEADSIEHKLVQGHHFLVEKYENASILAYFFLPPPQRVVRCQTRRSNILKVFHNDGDVLPGVGSGNGVAIDGIALA
jgi:hypothetical protein